MRDRVLDATAGLRPFAMVFDTRRGFATCVPPSDAIGLVALKCEEHPAEGVRTLRGLALEVAEGAGRYEAADREWATALIGLLAEPRRRLSSDRAIDVLHGVLARDSLDVTALNHMAVAFTARALARDDPRDMFLALDYIERAIRIDSLDPTVTYNRALLLDALGASDIALAAWSAAAAQDNRDWRADADARRLALEEQLGNHSSIDWAAFPLGDVQRVRERVLDSLLTAWSGAGLADRDTVVHAMLERIEAAALRTAALNSDSSLHWIARDLRANESPAGFRAVGQLAKGRSAYGRASLEVASRDLEEASRLLAEIDAPALEAWGRLGLAASHWGQQRFVPARHQLDLAGAAVRVLPSRSLEAQVDWLGALVRGRGGDLAGAESALARSVATFRSLHEYGNAGFSLASLAELHGMLGRPRAAALAVHEGLALSRFVGGARTEQLLSLGQHLLDRGLVHAAGPLLESAVLAAERSTRAKDLPEALARRARHQGSMGDAAGALHSIARARETLDVIPGGATRSRVAAEVDRAEAEALMRSDPVKSMAALDRARGVLSEIPLERPALRLMHGRLHLLRGDVDSARTDLLTALDFVERTRLPSTASARRALRRDWRDTQRELAELDLLVGDTTAALARARTLLGLPDTAVRVWRSDVPVLGIAALENHLLSWVEGTDGSIHVTRVRRAEHEADVTAFRTAVRTGIEGPVTLASGASIYRRTIGAHVGLVAAGALAIVTDETMADLPFGALGDAAGEALVKSLTITRYVPGATANVRFLRKSADGDLLLVSDPAIDRGAYSDLAPLTWARREGSDVARLAVSERILEGSAATVSSVTAGLRHASMLHYAGHAVVEDDVEEESYLVLAPDSTRGGGSRLTASVIAGTDLRSMQLAVLAACGRAWRGAKYDEAVNELVLAFLDGGAETVIAGLWEVEDEGTSALSVELHRRLVEGMDPAEALRGAQVELLEHGVSSGVVFSMAMHAR